MFPNKPKSISL